MKNIYKVFSWLLYLSYAYTCQTISYLPAITQMICAMVVNLMSFGQQSSSIWCHMCGNHQSMQPSSIWCHMCGNHRYNLYLQFHQYHMCGNHQSMQPLSIWCHMRGNHHQFNVISNDSKETETTIWRLLPIYHSIFSDQNHCRPD